MMMTTPANPSTTEMLDVIVRAAVQREYTKGGSVTNGAAFADAIKRSHLDNETAIPGSLRIAYLAALKTLDPVVTANTAAYHAWEPEEPTEPVATPEQRDYWLAIIAQKLAGAHGELAASMRNVIPLPADAIIENEPDICIACDHPAHTDEYGLCRDCSASNDSDDDDIPGYGDAA